MIYSSKTIVFMTLQSIVFVLSFLGNAVVIVICKYIKRKSVTYKFIVNLAIADMLTGVAVFLQVIYTIEPALNDNRYACLLRYQVIVLLTLTSQLTVTFTTLDRYIAICQTHRHGNIMTNTVSNILIVISWIYPSIICIVPFAHVHNLSDSNPPCLFEKVVPKWQLLLTSLTLWVFTIVTLIMYVFILKKACLLYRRRVNLSTRVCVLEDQSTNITSSRVLEHSRSVSDGRGKILNSLRGAKALAVVTVLFTICWLPHTYFQIRGFVDSEYLHSSEWEVANWLVFLGMSNSVTNPFIYAWQRQDFNLVMKSKLKCGRNIIHPLQEPRSIVSSKVTGC